MGKISRVTIALPEGTTLKTTRRKGDTSSTVLLTVNASTEVLVQAPAPVPAPTPAPAPAPAPQPPAPPPGLQAVTYKDSIPDLIDVSKFTPEVCAFPWTTFREDGVTIAHSLNGEVPDHFKRLPLYNWSTGYNTPVNCVHEGQVRSIYPPTTNGGEEIARSLRQGVLRGGPRGWAIHTPYWMVRGHDPRRRDGTVNTSPRLPLWIAVDMIGGVWYLNRDGSSERVAVAPIQSYCNDFSFFDHERETFWLVDSGLGKIIKGHRSGVTFTFETWTTVPGRASSIRAIGTKLYVADDLSGSVYEVDALDRSIAPVTICRIPHAFFVDHLSDNQTLVVMTLDRNVYLVDKTTGQAGRNISPLTPAMVDWVMVDVDRNGTCGLKDTLAICSAHGGQNTDYAFFGPDGVGRKAIGGGHNSLVGRSEKTKEAMHYPWLTVFHPHQALFWAQGGSNVYGNVYAAISARDTSWPAEDPYSTSVSASWGHDIMRVNVLEPAMSALRHGGSPGQGVPSFEVFQSSYGTSLLGCTPDHLAAMSIEERDEFLRRGMKGVYPNRTFSNQEMFALSYWQVRHSQRAFKEGQPSLLAELKVHYNITSF